MTPYALTAVAAALLSLAGLGAWGEVTRVSMPIGALSTTATVTIPETVPHPGINAQNGYVIGLGALDRTTDEGVRRWWHAPYLGRNGHGSSATLPYTADVWWTQGDRIAYSCAYGFLRHRGELVGRFTFAAVPEAAAYVRILDSYMSEGDYYWDGTDTPDGTGQAYRPRFCREVTASESYQPYTGPGELPRVVFWTARSEVAEIRDYRGLEAHPDIKFRLLEVTGPFVSSDGEGRSIRVTGRATVVAYEADLPVIVVYYDALGQGTVTADLPGP